MSEVIALLSQMRWQDVADIALVTFVVYQVILMVRGTRAMHMLLGLGVVLVMLVVSKQLGLYTIGWLINSFLSSLILVVIILFQSDIRRALANIGTGSFFGSNIDHKSTIEEVVRASVNLATRMTGGLIVMERQIGLADYTGSGVDINADVSRDLLVQLFQTSGPLHDGAVVISRDKIEAARCVLPLAASLQLPRHLGTRHRAALGLSQETDAVCIVISEERGRVSLAVSGELKQDLEASALRDHLTQLIGEKQKKPPKWFISRPKSAETSE
ncbi:diadenylate cyclase CdaA [Dethiosulfatarculus sandiegensis]|uniref:Diadenylate cyclase n=1 Tax=Dethiosulfatarculus sandiegensis TaxID=1429043 RepID=A0A0D2HNC1_9BACT|nr:diadenylate cyclase CdaA [Dethiosulfatarculus sandiegensis]KIX12028.1 hypothetical protein X474_21240 [Dethiosulfatarculus sandiegensis]